MAISKLDWGPPPAKRDVQRFIYSGHCCQRHKVAILYIFIFANYQRIAAKKRVLINPSYVFFFLFVKQKPLYDDARFKTTMPQTLVHTFSARVMDEPDVVASTLFFFSLVKI